MNKNLFAEGFAEGLIEGKSMLFVGVAATILLAMLKICGISEFADFSWCGVFAPLLISFAMTIVFALIVAALQYLCKKEN